HIRLDTLSSITYIKCAIDTNQAGKTGSMEETETRQSPVSDGRSAEQVSEAQAHHYDASKYERPSVTVDVLMMSLRQRDLQILLIKRRSWPFEGMWAIPGGFVNIHESLETAAKRELQE